MSVTRPYTADDLLAMGSDAPYELIEGELRRVSPTNFRAGEIAGNIFGELQRHVRREKLGRVATEGAGYVLGHSENTVLAPDVGFVRAERAHLIGEHGYSPVPPDLAVEVMSDSDRFIELGRKAGRYLEAGTRLVWVVRPERRTVTVFAPGREPFEVGPEGELDGEDVVPGFRLPLAEVFA